MAFNPSDTEAGTLQGRPVTRTKGRSKRLNLPATPAFVFKYHPTRWGVINGQWAPILSKMKLDPGVGGIGANMSEGGARENARQVGWTILDPDTIGEDYCVVYDGVNGAVHMEPWVEIKQVGGRVILKPDLDGYLAFLHRLIDGGHVAPLDEDIQAAIVAQQEARITRNSGKEDKVSKARAKKDTEKLETMKKPARKRKAKTTKKAASNG